VQRALLKTTGSIRCVTPFSRDEHSQFTYRLSKVILILYIRFTYISKCSQDLQKAQNDLNIFRHAVEI
jgi:hypothetical protein